MSRNSKLRARVGATGFRIFKNVTQLLKVLVRPNSWSQAFFVQAFYHSALINALYRSFASKRFTTACHKYGLQDEGLKTNPQICRTLGGRL